jgi:choline dehydrogenase-like flavoprotein
MTGKIIIGGGMAGCVLASRLRQRSPSLSVLLIEAGPNVTGHAHIGNPAEAAFLHGLDLDWKYMTVPQKHLDGKPRYNCAMKGLSGGTIINTGMFTVGIKGDDWDLEFDRRMYRWLNPRRRAGLRSISESSRR